VLVVDPLDETHEVLRTVLANRGVDVVASRDSGRGLELARRHRPQLVVLDVDADDGTVEIAKRLETESAGGAPQLVILGRTKREPAADGVCRFSKPYHYAALIHKIEELLAA
jgi:CheY-like chemotaxis protein